MLNYSYPTTLTVRGNSERTNEFPVEILIRIDTNRVDPNDPATYELAEITEKYLFRPETGSEIIGSEEEVRRHLEGLVGRIIQ